MADEALVLSLASTVEQIARKIHRGLPKHVELDDIRSAGWIGAMRAVEMYSPDHDTTLAQYAAIKIRSAILDWQREQDPLSRAHRRDLKETGNAAPATLSLDAPILEDMAMQVADPLSGESVKTVEAKALIRKLLRRAKLDSRYSYVVRRHLLGGVELDDIADRLEVTPSRCSQILQLGLKKLRAAYARRELIRKPIENGPLAEDICQNPSCGRRFEYRMVTWRDRGITLVMKHGQRGIRRRFCCRSCRSAGTYTHERKLPGRAALYRMYVGEGLSASQIARRVGCHQSSVQQAIVKHGIPRRSANGEFKRRPTNCPRCRAPCTGRKAAQRHCAIPRGPRGGYRTSPAP